MRQAPAPPGRALTGSRSIQIGDRGTARITSTADLLIIDFDTALGTAHIEIQRDTFGIAEGRVPFEMHALIGGRQLVDSQYLAGYQFFGTDATAPWAFMVRVSIPGSGPQPRWRCTGTAARVRRGPSVSTWTGR